MRASNTYIDQLIIIHLSFNRCQGVCKVECPFLDVMVSFWHSYRLQCISCDFFIKNLKGIQSCNSYIMLYKNGII